MTQNKSYTEAKADEGNLEQSRMLAALPTPVLVLDRSNKILVLNPAAEQLFDLSFASVSGQKLERYLANDHPLFLLLDLCRGRQGLITDHNLHLSSPLIGNHFVAVNLAPVDPDCERLIINLTPLSNTKKFAEHWKQRSVARTMDGFTAMLGHEIKNPLSGIKGAAQLLMSSVENSEDRELLDLIIDETERVANLVESMEAFNLGEALVPSPVNIHKVLMRVKSLAQAGFAQEIEIKESFDPSLPDIAADENMMIQVILNLVKNAAEALEGAPSPRIWLETRYRHGVQFNLQDGSTVTKLPLQVVVRDNGPGITEDVQSKLFTPFITSKPKGKGLGLALVSKIIQDIGGVMEVQTEPGNTSFSLLLPEFKGEMHRPILPIELDQEPQAVGGVSYV